MGHVVCKLGLMVDPMKITMILNLEASRSVKWLCATLGHIRYYRKFIKGYAQITVPMQKLFKRMSHSIGMRNVRKASMC